MIRHILRYKTLLLIFLLVGCHPLRGCVESEFTLSPESRLPKWFTLPTGLSRSDVFVTLVYYTSGTVRITLRANKGKTLAEIVGEKRWHPQTIKKQNKYGGFDQNSYPHYVIVSANGIVEIIEHRQMEPIFYITDDPSVR